MNDEMNMTNSNIPNIGAETVGHNPSYASLATKNRFSLLSLLEDLPRLPTKYNYDNHNYKNKSSRDSCSPKPSFNENE